MGKECDFTATGETAQDVKDKMMEHAKAEHKDMLDSMSDSEKNDMMAMMDEKMKPM
jgi:predicted small metal-binding protein